MITTTFLLRPFCLIAPKNYKLFGFPIFRFSGYLMKFIPETRRVH